MVNVKRYIIPDSLTESSGTITAIINGKSFQITPNFGSLSANTRYQLYMLPGGTLEVSSLELSQAPADRILIGSFYTTDFGGLSFGAFISIVGTPTSETFKTDVSYNNLGSLGVDDFLEIKRVGDRALINYSMSVTSTDTSTSTLSINSPFGGQGFAAGPAGSYTIFDFQNNNVHLASEAQVTSTPGVISFIRPQTTGSLVPNEFTASSYIRATFNLKVSDWLDTPIKDL